MVRTKNSRTQKPKTGLSLKRSFSFLDLISGYLTDSEFVESLHRSTDVDNPLIGVLKSIQLENVWFSYDGNKDNAIIRGVSFEIKEKESVALVGINGAGKTSLIKLISGLYEPNSGTIYYNGIPHTNLNPEDIRNHFSVILQEYCKYGVTLGGNITFQDEYSHKTLEELAGQVDFAKSINNLDKRWETPMLKRIYDEGRDLSEGQWQKIAALRGFYKSADVFIMDEPSSALDAQSEEKFYEAVKGYKDCNIRIIISHRLACIRDVTRIIVLDNGCIIQDGSHVELMKDNAVYQNLYNVQSRKYSLT